MKSRGAAILSAAVILVSCGESSTPTTPTPSSSATAVAAAVRVSGRVLDYASGKSIPGYTVQWRTGSNSHLLVHAGQLTTVTDAAGRFDLYLPVTDDFTPLSDTLLFENPQHELSGSIRIPSKSIETDLLVNPGGCNVRYGYVYDAVTRQPIAGARVVRRNAASTDANGFYRLEIVCDAPAGQSFGIGTTTLGVSHPAYRGTSVIDGRSEWTGLPGINRVDFALQPLQ
jgi:hypothetical protein